jgi:hypothetical protein
MKVRRKKSDSTANEMKGVVDGLGPSNSRKFAKTPKANCSSFFLREKGGGEKRKRFLQGVPRGAMGSRSLQEHKDPAFDDLSYCWSLPSYSEL